MVWFVPISRTGELLETGAIISKTVTQLVERDIASLRPYARNARTHSKKQVKQIAASIDRFGFTNPVLVSDDGEIRMG